VAVVARSEDIRGCPTFTGPVIREEGNKKVLLLLLLVLLSDDEEVGAGEVDPEEGLTRLPTSRS
jgi:hypothetical protein